MALFSSNNLEHTYPDPNNPRQLLARSEVDHRGTYSNFEHLEKCYIAIQGECRIPFGGCGQAVSGEIPEERLTAEQLVRVLEALKGDIAGTCGELTIVDAVRLAKTTMAQI